MGDKEWEQGSQKTWKAITYTRLDKSEGDFGSSVESKTLA